MKLIREKSIKYLFNLMVIMVAFLLMGEMAVRIMFQESAFPYAEVLTSDLETEDLAFMQEELLKNDILLVIKEWYAPASDGETKVLTLYGSEEAIGFYAEKSGLGEGAYISFFDGDSIVKYADIGEWEASEEYVTLYFMSEENAKQVLSAEQIWGLGLNDIYGSVVDIRAKVKKQNYLLWGIIVCMLLLFSYYDCIQQKKQFFVRASLGETIGEIILQNILMDTVYYLLAFGVSAAFAARNTYIPSDMTPIWVCFGVLLVGNALLYLPLLGYSFREALTKNQLSKKALPISYGLRLVTLIAVIVLINLNLVISKEYFEATRNGAFFRYYKNGYVISSADFEYSSTDYAYLELTDDEKTSLFFAGSEYKDSSGTYQIIYLNDGSAEWLFDKYPSLKISDIDEDIIVLYPNDISDTETLKSENYAIALGMEDASSYKFISYSKNIQVPGERGAAGFTGASDFDIYENPVIVLDLREDMLKFKEGVYPYASAYFMEAYLVEMDGETEDSVTVTLGDGRDYTLESVYSAYLDQISTYQKSFYWELSILALVFLLEIALTVKIIRLEFETNAMKYVLQRIFGSNIWEVYGTLFIFTTLLCVAGAVIAKLILGSEVDWMVSLAVGGCMWLIETVLILGNILYIEHVNMQKILKGGAL